MSEGYWQRFWQRRASRRAFLRGGLYGGVGLAAAALLACRQEAPTASPAAEGARPRPGGVLPVAFGLEPSSLDPHTGVSGGDHYYFTAIFDFLVAHDQNNELQAEASLASGWELVDPTTIVFRLRPGVSFHDGTPFNAEAVRWNIERVKDPQLRSTARANFLVVERVETPDAQTARFLLREPSAPLLYLLGERGGAMVSPTAAERLGDQFKSQPVGTGPFLFEEWRPGSHVRLRRNPNYWRRDRAGNPLPYLEQVNLRIIPQPETALAALLTGEVLIAGVQPKDLPQAQGSPDLQVLERRGSSVASLLVFHHGLPPADNGDFRRAVAYALDPEAVNKTVYFGRMLVADAGMWPPGTWVYQPVPDRPRYDPQRARDFLRRAGYSGPASVKMITYSAPLIQQQTEVYQEQLRAVGINVDLTVQDVGQATQAFFAGNQFPIYSTSWSLYPEPDWIGSLNYSRDGFYNPAKKTDPELQGLLEQGRREYDQNRRKEIYHRVNQIVLREALFVPLLYGVAFVGVNRKVANTASLWTGEAKWRFPELWLTS